MTTPIVVEELTKRFGSFAAVDDVSFTAREGAITALLGPSGSGKSTVLRMIAGLEHPTSGRIWMGSEELTVKSVQERQVGFVFQHYALFRHMTVAENVSFGLQVRKESKGAQKQRVDDLLELVQLAHFRDRYPDQLSGGQRQRVALARALAVEPRVLLLDEPFGALDARVRQELRRWLRRLHDDVHVTSVFVTHDQEEALEVADRVVVMNHGRIEQEGSPEHVYDHPATPFVFEFLGHVNRLPRAGPANADAFARPHEIEVLARPGHGTLAARLIHGATAGPMARLEFALADGGATVTVEIDRERWSALALSEGTVAYLKPTRLRAFPSAA